MITERLEFVSLDQLDFDEEFKNALGELEQRIFEDYSQFMPADPNREGYEVEHKMTTEFKKGLAYSPKGSKYLKVCTGTDNGQTSVWGFISKGDFQAKNKKKTGGQFIEFKEGDILKAAGWNTPILNSPRGNIFKKDYTISWTGPNYLT